jgi:hypothetical protein
MGAVGSVVPIAAPRSYPLPPFVISDEQGGDEEDGENAEEDLHGLSRIA